MLAGNAKRDRCGVCEGDGTQCADCAGDVLCANGSCKQGSARIDNCGSCRKSAAEHCGSDCGGIWGGSAKRDECGICGGDKSSCSDCAGVLFGRSRKDECGACGASSHAPRAPCAPSSGFEDLPAHLAIPVPVPPAVHPNHHCP